MKPLSIILTLAIAITAYAGDFIVFNSRLNNLQAFRALLDNFIHASIGFLSSLLFFNDSRVSSYALYYNVIFCTLISSLIDFDHVLLARSFKWKDISNLKQRGIFHCTTFWLAITIILILYSQVFKKSNIYVLTWMLIIAYSSHHIRDGNRRGLWMYPFGNTPAFNKATYIMLLCGLPHLFSFAYRNTINNMYKHTTIEYKSVV